MKTFLRIIFVSIVLGASATLAAAQGTGSSGQDAAAGLRAQLSDVQAKEAELQARERQLDEEMRPENIALSIVGVGTTKPEELREQRRKQLESDKARVRAQLDQLAQSRTRLEAAIATADADAYRRSAQVTESLSTTTTQPAAQETKTVPARKTPRRAVRRRRARRH